MSTRKVRFGITAKAVAIVTLLMAASAAGIVAASVRAERATLVSDAVMRASEVARTASVLAGPDIIAERSGELTEMFDQFASQPGVAYAFAIGVNGRFLAGADPALDGELGHRIDALATRAWTRDGEELEIQGDVLHVARAIEHDGRVVGILRLGFTLGHIAQRTKEMVFRSVAYALLGFLVVAPLTGATIAFAMRPIRKLIDAAERIGRRDFDVALDIKTGDEFQVLAEALNDMAAHLRTSMKRIRQLAFLDELTRLPNKTGFMEQSRRILAQTDMPSAALLIDLDRFKRLNDIYGPREGDKLLASAAHRMHAAAKRTAEHFRHPDARPPLLARISGDEYALLLCGPSPTSAAKEAAREILESLREPFPLKEGEAVLSASIGIARSPIDGREIEELMRLANLALDGIKADGGDGYRFFETEMTRRAVQRMNLENELRRAIANREFLVHYQPKVDARTGETSGCEALVRWRRGGDIVGPGAFIPAAEDCGLISGIGEFVLEEACAAAARWRAKGLICPVAVNVSAMQFQLGGFSRTVLDTLEATGLPPHMLELEITESVAMRDPDDVIKQVTPMREKGVRFAIDDFGTGHSSLASLTRMPFDTFKIDQTFVRQMETDPSARVVVETILAMARALGYDTVGEGVETPTQFAFLRLNGCTTAQGWYFGKPVAEDEFVARLEASLSAPPSERKTGSA